MTSSVSRTATTSASTRITWECDYPHSDSQWPHSRKHAAEVLLDIPDDEVHKIVELNARSLLNLDAGAAR